MCDETTFALEEAGACKYVSKDDDAGFTADSATHLR